MSTRITYWIRVSDSAYQESSPEEIQRFMSQGFVPDIRIHPEWRDK